MYLSTPTIAKLLSLIGTLFILAMAFAIIPTNYGLFAGVIFYTLAGFVWTFPPRSTRK